MSSQGTFLLGLLKQSFRSCGFEFFLWQEPFCNRKNCQQCSQGTVSKHSRTHGLASSGLLLPSAIQLFLFGRNVLHEVVPQIPSRQRPCHAGHFRRSHVSLGPGKLIRTVHAGPLQQRAASSPPTSGAGFTHHLCWQPLLVPMHLTGQTATW